MRTPTSPHATARTVVAALAMCCATVTGCGLSADVATVDAPPADALPVSGPSPSVQEPEAAPTTIDPAVEAQAWDFVGAWYTADQWDAAVGYAVALTTYVHALWAAAPHPAPTTRQPLPAPPRATQAASGGAAPGGFLSCVRQRESRGSYTVVNGSSGAGGAYQFLPSTWQGSGAAGRTGVPRAEMATPAQQDAEAQRLYASSGRSPWAGPGC